ESTKRKFNELFFKNDYAKDLVILKRELGILGCTIPTLYKQYSELCEEGGVEFIDFGRDRHFENCIDGFLLVSIDKIKEQKQKRYLLR
ncbi:MAG: GNAT family N-acetyltransferase, partial [Sulfurimonadaceae bacterium]